jgi:hypothetical protein
MPRRTPSRATAQTEADATDIVRLWRACREQAAPPLWYGVDDDGNTVALRNLVSATVIEQQSRDWSDDDDLAAMLAALMERRV